jgi:hypothetical protein
MIKVLPLTNCKDFSNLIQIAIPELKNKHYLNNSILGIYYFDIKTHDRFYHNINHQDWQVQNEYQINGAPKFSLEKKLLKNNNYNCGIDLNFLLPNSQSNIKFVDFIPSKFKRYFVKHNKISVLPLSIIFEICEDILVFLNKNLILNDDRINSAIRIDELFYDSLYKTEKNQIIKYDTSGHVYNSDYNPYTITNRPTNSSGGINFTALSKKDNTRSSIIAGENNLLVQFDYSAFHPYLISKMLKIPIPTEVDYYIYLNKQFKFSESEERDKIKEDFFKLIYGYKKGRDEFSKQIHEFEKDLSAQYKTKSSVTSFVLKRELFFKQGLNDNLLFNYFLQNMETEYNLIKLKQILTNIDQNDASLILYIYDSFVFRIQENKTEIIQKIEQILTTEGFPVKIYTGKNLQDLQLIN